MEDILTQLLRLLLAFLAGSVMGWERERYLQEAGHVRGAGFRTYTLVCFGSAIFAIASIYGFKATGATVDPGRVAAQVVTGIGFLGAGTILKDRGSVRGLTTAAGLWVAAGIGLMIGAGMYVPGLAAALLAYLALALHRMFPRLSVFRVKYGRKEFPLHRGHEAEREIDI